MSAPHFTVWFPTTRVQLFTRLKLVSPRFQGWLEANPKVGLEKPSMLIVVSPLVERSRLIPGMPRSFEVVEP